MANEILFRGFHPDEKGDTTIKVKLVGHKDFVEYKGRWVYGLLFSRIGGGFFPDGVSAIRIDDGKQNIFGVIAETVSQFVATDKNNKKVFVGDYVKTKFGRICEVAILDNDENKCVDLIPIANIKEGDNGNCPTKWDLWRKDNIKVVGNIYENQDMKYGV